MNAIKGRGQYYNLEGKGDHDHNVHPDRIHNPYDHMEENNFRFDRRISEQGERENRDLDCQNGRQYEY